MFRQKNQTNISYYQENSSLEFESLLNNINEWQSNPTEATRYCFKHIYNIIRLQQKRIENLDKQKASKSEVASSLNIKANITDVMKTLNEVALNMEQRPTKNEILNLFEEKASKEELYSKLDEKVSFEEIKNYLNEGKLKINIELLMNDLNRNFVNIQNFTETMENKINKENVIKMLEQEANISDLNIFNNELKNIKKIENKIKEIDNDFDRLIDNIKKQFNSVSNTLDNMNLLKADQKNFEIFNNKLIEIENKINNKNSLITNDITEFNQKIDDISKNFEFLNNNINIIDKKYEKITTGILKNNFYENEISKIYEKTEKIENQINKISNLINNKLDKQEIEFLNKKINEIKEITNNTQNKLSENKKNLTSDDLEELYSNIFGNIQTRFEDMQNYTKDFLKKFDNDIIQNLDNKANKEDLQELLSLKIDINNLKTIISKKNEENSSNEINNLINNISQNYLSKNEYQNMIKNIDEIKNELILKSNINEMMVYLKDKADINEVNKALTLIHNELDNKLFIQDFNHAMKNQNSINTTLVQENKIGRWIWDSGNLRNGHGVPWEMQKINTCPDNYMWNKDTINLVINNKGIYNLNLIFFVNSFSMVKIFINGEIAFCKDKKNNFNEGNDIILEENNNGMNNNVNNVKINEYLLIDEKSRISVTYAGSDNVKAILEIKEL